MEQGPYPGGFASCPSHISSCLSQTTPLHLLCRLVFLQAQGPASFSVPVTPPKKGVFSLLKAKNLLGIKDSTHLKFLRKPSLTVDRVVQAENSCGYGTVIGHSWFHFGFILHLSTKVLLKRKSEEKRKNQARSSG